MNNKVTSYLSQLKFDPNLYNNLVAKYILNIRIVILLLIAIIAFGITSFFQLPRRLNPQAELPIVTVVTVLPGAGPEDIESLVTEPLEDKLLGTEDLDTLESQSKDNASVITLSFEIGVDLDKATANVQQAVDSVTNLPDDTQTPEVIKLDIEDQAIWTFNLTANNDLATLDRFCDVLKGKVEGLTSIDRVEVTGKEKQEIQVLIKEEAQRVFRINALSLSEKVKSALSSYPAGEVKTDNLTFALTIDPTITSLDELRALRLNIAGQNVKLSQIAEISQKSSPAQNNKYLATNSQTAQKVITFNVFKAKGANIDEAARDAQDMVDITLADYPNIGVSTSMDLAELIQKQYDDVTNSFKYTIFFVFLVLFTFLGIRQAMIVSLAIPLSFLVAFIVMNVVGLTLNFLSLFALILSLGLLVDTAIVIVTAITTYYRTNKFTPAEAGLLTLRDFIAPIWATTITTVWAFLPLLISSGILGEFIKTMPILVSAIILASASLSVLITLPLMIVLLKPQVPSRVRIFLIILVLVILIAIIIFTFINNPLLPIIIPLLLILALLTYKIRKNMAANILNIISRYANTTTLQKIAGNCIDCGIINVHTLSIKYQRFIEKVLSSTILRKKTIIAVVIFSLFSYILIPLGFVVNEFFPKTNQNQIFVNLQFPPGTNLETARDNGLDVLEDLRHINGLDTVTAQTGTGLNPEFYNPISSQNSLLYIIALKDKDERETNSIDIAQNLRISGEQYTKGELSVFELSGGPPVGADLQIQLSGDDLLILDQNADKLVNYLKSIEGTTNVKKSVVPRTSKLVFIPNKNKLAVYGISEAQIGLALRTFTSGFKLDSVKFNGVDEHDINFRNSANTQIPEAVTKVTILTMQGEFPLSSLGKFEMRPNPTQITRENGKRSISVTAGVLKDFAPPVLSAQLEEFANTINLPTGYEWQTGGLNEENQQAVNDILRGMLIASILILATMVVLLGSYRKAAIVLLVIPLALSGVFIIFGLTGTPLSFPTLIGLLALFGIVVNNSILIVYKINQNLRLGMMLKAAISDAAASRVEPIFFSSLTTIVGLTAITLSDPLWRGLGGAIISGLIFSGTIMLLFIPVVYYIIFKEEIR